MGPNLAGLEQQKSVLLAITFSRHGPLPLAKYSCIVEQGEASLKKSQKILYNKIFVVAIYASIWLRGDEGPLAYIRQKNIRV